MQQLQLLCRVAKESPDGPLPTTSRQINPEKRSANTKSTIKAIHGEERGWFYSAQKQLAACTHTPSPLPFLSLHSHRPTPAVYSVAPQPLTTHPPRATGRRHTHTPKRLRDTGKPRGFLTVSPGITPAGPNRDPSRRRALLSPGPGRDRPRPSRPAPRRRYAAAPRQVPPHNGASRPAPLRFSPAAGSLRGSRSERRGGQGTGCPRAGARGTAPGSRLTETRSWGCAGPRPPAAAGPPSPPSAILGAKDAAAAARLKLPPPPGPLRRPPLTAARLRRAGAARSLRKRRGTGPGPALPRGQEVPGRREPGGRREARRGGEPASCRGRPIWICRHCEENGFSNFNAPLKYIWVGSSYFSRLRSPVWATEKQHFTNSLTQV